MCFSRERNQVGRVAVETLRVPLAQLKELLPTREGSCCELKFFFPNRLVEPLPSSKQAKEYVAETLTPALTAGLVALCRAKPTNPAEFLAHYLLENNRRAA